MLNGKRAPRAPWSADEERIIREHTARVSVAEIAKLVGGSEKAVYNYVSRERITARDYREWTAEDLAQLGGLYEYMTVPQIAAQLGRSADSVRQRVTRLDIGKREAARGCHAPHAGGRSRVRWAGTPRPGFRRQTGRRLRHCPILTAARGARKTFIMGNPRCTDYSPSVATALDQA